MYRERRKLYLAQLKKTNTNSTTFFMKLVLGQIEKKTLYYAMILKVA
jgi:hypothetical protein